MEQANPSITSASRGLPFAHRGSSTHPHATSVTSDASALDAAADAVIQLDADLRVTAWNSQAGRLYGLPAAKVLRRHFRDVVLCIPGPAACAVPHHPLLHAAGLHNGPAKHVIDDREIAVTVTIIPLDLPQRQAHYLAVVHDETEHVRIAASLEERLKFEMLLTDLSARFTTLPEEQIDGEIEHWLRRLVETLDVDRSTFAEVSPNAKITVTHSYAAPGIEPYPKGVANQHLPWLAEQLNARRAVALSSIPEGLPQEADVERRYCLDHGLRAVLAIPVCVADSLVCVLTFAAFRRARTWPAELVSRLHQAGDTFANAIARRHAKKELEQKRHELAHVARVAAMGELASVIAHELDQPLTAIVSNAEAIRYLLNEANPDLTEAGEALRDVIDSAMRVSEIVKRERRLLRKSQQEFQSLDLNDAVRDIELFIRAEARHTGARVVLELVPGLLTVRGDRIQLQQVVLNLARNGVQAMKDQPIEDRQLTIRSASVSGEVTLSVTDAGPPADETWLGRMFEPFYTTKPGGLGMGLSISKSILDAHHGRIWADRNPGGGVTMHIAIPRK